MIPSLVYRPYFIYIEKLLFTNFRKQFSPSFLLNIVLFEKFGKEKEFFFDFKGEKKSRNALNLNLSRAENINLN